jgi:hypothetical protein
MTLLVRDEADIVRQNVAFHLEHGVDFVIVTDNRSVDGTRDILEELSRQGSLRVIDEPGDDFSQDRWVTRMALLAREEHGADWIISGDGDEFWRAASGDLKAELAETDAETNMVVCARRHMVFPHDRRPGGPWYRDLVYRVARPLPMPTLRDPLADALPAPYFYLDLPAKVLYRARGLEAAHPGNHWASYDTGARGASGSVEVYHYPVRSFDQFSRKVRNAGSGHLRNTTAPPLAGWHHRRWYRMLLAGDGEVAFREALPSGQRLDADLRDGTAVVDLTMIDGLARVSGERRFAPPGSRSGDAGDTSDGPRRDGKATPVCVLGMHRSGTSAVTRVLNLLGVHLGPPDRLTRPLADNPEGFWEHSGLVSVNDAILARFGGSWDDPPALPPGWERSETIADQRERAMHLLEADFSEAPEWGWKDPRTCLTLPFWQALLPPMRYVICLRSPLSVARSLRDRDGFSSDRSGCLWLLHVASALIRTAGHPRLITSYERLVDAFEPELRRLAEFVGRAGALTDALSREIGATIRQDLCHHRNSVLETLDDRTLPFAARALYAALCRSGQGSGEGGEDGTEDLAALARAAIEDETALTTLRLRADHEGLQAAHERLERTVARLQAHPMWRGYLRLRRAWIPEGSRREATLRRWLQARRPKEG